MKLLIITQVIDKDHPILAFFHCWVEVFAKEYESIEVICLQAGEFDFPSNVTVHSLGKESGGGNKIKYLWRFYRLLWQLHHRYDDVFVHMNQIYVILGGLYWRLIGKRIGLWYTHGSAPLTLRIASLLTHHIFSASRDSFLLGGSYIDRKIIVAGHGIDTNLFRPGDTNKDIDLLTVGRLSPSKNLELLLMVLKKLQTDTEVRLTMIGSPALASDQEYVAKLKKQAESLAVADLIDWVGAVPNEELPNYLGRAKVFVHSSRTGSLDKALLEPLAMGVPVVTSAIGAKSLPLGDWQVTEVDEMTEAIRKLLQTLPTKKIERLRDLIINNHNLQNLILRITHVYYRR